MFACMCNYVNCVYYIQAKGRQGVSSSLSPHIVPLRKDLFQSLELSWDPVGPSDLLDYCYSLSSSELGSWADNNSVLIPTHFPNTLTITLQTTFIMLLKATDGMFTQCSIGGITGNVSFLLHSWPWRFMFSTKLMKTLNYTELFYDFSLLCIAAYFFKP